MHTQNDSNKVMNLMRKYCLIILPFLFNLIAQDSNSPDTVLRRIDCATPSSTEEQILQTSVLVENWLSDNRDRPEEQVHIWLRFMFYASDGTGNISDEAIYDQFEWLNLAYEPHNIYFTVDTINRVENVNGLITGMVKIHGPVCHNWLLIHTII